MKPQGSTKTFGEGDGEMAGPVSPALAAGILAAALDCVIVIDHESRVVEWNGAAEQTFGYTRAEALGRDMAELIIPPALRDAHRAGLARYLSAGHGPILNQRIEVRAIRRNGQEFPVELTVVPVEESPPRFAAYLRDITEREEREASLRRSEERFRSLIEATAEIVWTRQPNGEFGNEQPGWSAFTGQPYDDLKGWGWLHAIHPQDREQVAEAWATAVHTGGLYETEYRMRRSDGAIRRMAVRAAPVREPDGSVREWVGVSTDVTERREAEQRLAEGDAHQRAFLRDVLVSVTGGKLRLCDNDAALPVPLPGCGLPVPLTGQSLRAARHTAMEAARAAGLDSNRANDLLIAVGEATQNAVRHAGGGQVRVCADEGVGLVQVWTEDQGTGIEVARLPQATLERGYSGGGGGFGHGFWLMLQTVDRVWLLTGPRGTTVVLEQGREAPQPNWLAEM
jgi:PAS domain S-box-containing protein